MGSDSSSGVSCSDRSWYGNLSIPVHPKFDSILMLLRRPIGGIDLRPDYRTISGQ